jgi:hypothetical protein
MWVVRGLLPLEKPGVVSFVRSPLFSVMNRSVADFMAAAVSCPFDLR